MSTMIKQEPVRLTYTEENRQVVIDPKDNDKYVLTVLDAIEACRQYAKGDGKKFQEQFDQLKNYLGRWVYERRQKINQAFLTIRDAGLLLLLVTESKEYDSDFEDDLTELDLKIAHSQDFDRIPLSVQSLPQCSSDCYESFCAPNSTLVFVKDS